jgi:hypothetical protein
MPAWLTARLIAYGLAGAALLAALSWAGFQIRAGQRALEALPIARAETRAALDALETARKDAERNRRISDAYQTRLEAITADLRAHPLGPVRLCKQASPPVRAPGATPGTDAPGPGPVAGPPESHPGPDIGPALQAYGEDAARCAAQLTALQRWVRERP